MNTKKHGGTREGAGRKPKADEIKMLDSMDATKSAAEVWQKLADRVDEGDTTAIKTWLAYRYGKPQAKVDLTSDGQKLGGFKVICDD